MNIRDYSLQVGLAFLILVAATATGQEPERSKRFEPLRYQNAGAITDLGVGLWAWPVVADVNGDGLTDLIVTSSGQSFSGTYYFENRGRNEGSTKYPIFKSMVRIGPGDHNVCGSWVEGKLRVLSPGKEFPTFCKTGLTNPVALPLQSNVHTHNVRGNMWRYVDFNGDGKTDLVVGTDDWTDYGWANAYDAQGNWRNGPLRGNIYIALNLGTNEQPDYEAPFMLKDPYGRNLEVFGWPSPNFVDYDDDGDLDIICGCFLDYFTCFENIGTRTSPVYMDRGVLVDPTGQKIVMDLEMITPVVCDWDSDGDSDIICGDEDGRVALIENTEHFVNSKPVFLQPHYLKQEADLLKCGNLCSPCGCDWDGDGDWDIICGNAAGYICFIENLSGPGVDPPVWAVPVKLSAGEENPFRLIAGTNGSIQGPAEEKWGYITESVADWDGDGLLDIIVNTIRGRVFWLKNIGTQTAPKLADPEPIYVEWNGEQPVLPWGWDKPEGKELLTQWRTTPVAFDWNQDGLMDLIMLDHEGFLAFFERKQLDDESRILLPPVRIFKNEDGSPLQLNRETAGASGRRKLCLADWNGDGLIDLIANDKNAEVWLQIENQGDSVLFRNTGSLTEQTLAGHSTHPSVVDFDNDGVLDLILGAEDGFIYYYKNEGVLNAK
ncbi:MAG: VCBS repeat-containing protein [Planctomycetia bacterium]|nr:VCBS repeat-containing protein [Planctomycetia bacterium]